MTAAPATGFIASCAQGVVEASAIVVVKFGAVAKVSAPVPVSSVVAEMRFALEGVAAHVATPAPRPEMPVEMGSPVALVSVPELGVPSAPLKVTKAPAEPTFTASAVPTPVPSPVIPEIGRPVPLVSVTAEGVPRFGVVKTGDVERTMLPVPVTALFKVTPPYVRLPFVPPAVEAPIKTLPPTEKFVPGEVVEMPARPAFVMMKFVAVLDPTTNWLDQAPAIGLTASVAHGVEDPYVVEVAGIEITGVAPPDDDTG